MKQTFNRLGAAATLLVLVAGFGLVQAQTPSAVSGTVVALDPAANTVTIKSDAGATQTFLVAESTSMRSAGKDITVAELKVGDHVRVEPAPGEASDAATQTASRLEVVGTPLQGSAGSAETYGTPQRTVSTDRPVLGEGPDAGGDRLSEPASPGSTTGRSVSTDRPVLGQSPTPSPSPAPSAVPSPSPAPSPSTSTSSPTPSPTYIAQATPPPPSSAGSSADVDADADREEDLPETASPLPLVGAMGLLALLAGLALRATRKQHS